MKIVWLIVGALLSNPVLASEILEDENGGRIECFVPNRPSYRVTIEWSDVVPQEGMEIPVVVSYRNRWSPVKSRGILNVRSVGTPHGLETHYHVSGSNEGFYDLYEIHLKEIVLESTSTFEGTFTDHWGGMSEVSCKKGL